MPPYLQTFRHTNRHHVVKIMAEAFTFIERGLSMFEQQNPNIKRFSKVSTCISDTILRYHLIYDKKKK